MKRKTVEVRRTFSDAQKRAAVARVVKGGETQTAVWKDIGVNSSVLSRWIRQLSASVKKSPTVPTHIRVRPPAPPANKKKNYYVPVAEGVKALEASQSGGGNGAENLQRRIHACVGLLRGIRGKIDTNDPVHLTAALVLATLEGKM